MQTLEQWLEDANACTCLSMRCDTDDAFYAANVTLPVALKIIRELTLGQYGERCVPTKDLREVAERIINEDPNKEHMEHRKVTEPGI